MPHIHEKIDYSVSVYIVFENRVLLHLHKKLNRWLPVGGHVELDEDPNEAAIREAKEESGLDVSFLNNTNVPGEFEDYGMHKQLIVPNYSDRHEVSNVVPYHEHIDHVYFARAKTGELKPEEGIVLRWFEVEELSLEEYKLPRKIIFYAREALKVASGNY